MLRQDDLNEFAIALLLDLEDQLLPRPPIPLQKLNSLLYTLGAVAVGCIAASFSCLMLFIVLTLILHYQPS